MKKTIDKQSINLVFCPVHVILTSAYNTTGNPPYNELRYNEVPDITNLFEVCV